MKHIGFDQSTVLNEFARIAHEKGLIKKAEIEIGDFGEEAPKPGAKPATPNLDKLLAGQAVELEKYWPEVSPYFQYMFQQAGSHENFLKQSKGAVDTIKRALFAYFKSVNDPKGLEFYYKQLDTMFRPTGPKEPGQLERPNIVMSPMADDGEVTASASDENVKTADEKKYDVTGETGEQLVNDAHPGGGTKTELTHSKTDENLVETIVEQQKKDVEVAHSVPKGTYAALVDLYNKLHKMGHKDRLNGLAKTIHIVATEEDIVMHTLVTLADELDRRGFQDVASSVDELFKKKLAEPYVDPGVAEFGGSMPEGEYQPRTEKATQAIQTAQAQKQKLQAQKNTIMEAAKKELVAAVRQKAPPLYYARIDAVDLSGNISDVTQKLREAMTSQRTSITRQYSNMITQTWQSVVNPKLEQMKTINTSMAQLDQLIQQQSAAVKAPVQPAQPDAGIAGKDEKPDEKKPEEKKKKKNWLSGWQKDPAKIKAIVNRYNKAVSGVEGEEQVSADKAGAQKALDHIRQIAGGKVRWRQFETAMKEKGKGVAGREPPAPPKGPVDYTRHADIRDLIEKKVIQKLGPDGEAQVRTKEWTRWINNQAAMLYDAQGREGKKGPPEYTPGEMIAQITNLVKRL